MRFPRTLLLLGWVSLLTDFSSEMIYPLLPAFMTSLGGGVAWLGMMEGLAGTIAAILKLLSGRMSDRLQRRAPLVHIGYLLSNFFRSLLSLAPSPAIVLMLRALDRVGKGLRAAPRDALISEIVDEKHRGAAYGFHRAMDHAGAMVGPLVAALCVGAFALRAKTVIALAAIPATASCILVLLVRDPRTAPRRAPAPAPAGCLRLGVLLIPIALFSLAYSSELLLLDRFSRYLSVFQLTLLWAAHSGIRMLSNYYGGRVSDRKNARAMLAVGWLLFSACFLGFATLESSGVLALVFLLYAATFGLIEPCERLLVAGLAPKEQSGQAFGLFHFITSFAMLLSSAGTGILLEHYGPLPAFGMSSGLSALAAVLLLLVGSGYK